MPAGGECEPCMRVHFLSVLDRLTDKVEVLDTVSGTWSTLEPGAPLPIDVPTQRDEVLCEYTEHPCARYTSGQL